MADPEADSSHFIAVLIKCLALLEKLPVAVNVCEKNKTCKLFACECISFSRKSEVKCKILLCK